MKQQIETLRWISLVPLFAVSAVFVLSGCNIKTVRSETPAEKPPEVSDLPADNSGTPTPLVQAPAIGLLAPVDNRSQITEPVIELKKISGVPASTALGWLKNGNKRYLKGFVRKDGQAAKDIEKLSAKQTPHSIVFSCSDSRVPPEIVFDQKLGEIFVVRTAGLSAEPAVVASLEYAVSQLGPQLLVVMGHSSCGAVKLKSIAQELISESQILRQKVETGELTIKTAVYNLGHGNVDFEE